jgi:hypothetical protein
MSSVPQRQAAEKPGLCGTVFNLCNRRVFLDAHVGSNIFELTHDYSDRANREHSSSLEIA